MDTVSSASPSSATAFEVQSSSKSNKLTLDGDSASLNIQDHDGSSYGLELAGTLVTSTAAELNFLDGFGDAAYDASADSVVFFDATDSKLKRESANDFELIDSKSFDKIFFNLSNSS